jgi:hypothetical protein
MVLEQVNDARANPAGYGAAVGLNLSRVPRSQPLAFDPRIKQVIVRLHSLNNVDRIKAALRNNGVRFNEANSISVMYGGSMGEDGTSVQRNLMCSLLRIQGGES